MNRGDRAPRRRTASFPKPTPISRKLANMLSQAEIHFQARKLVSNPEECKQRMKALPPDLRIPVSRALDEIAGQAAWASARLQWLAINRDDEEGADKYARAKNKAIRKALGYR